MCGGGNSLFPKYTRWIYLPDEIVEGNSTLPTMISSGRILRIEAICRPRWSAKPSPTNNTLALLQEVPPKRSAPRARHGKGQEQSENGALTILSCGHFLMMSCACFPRPPPEHRSTENAFKYRSDSHINRTTISHSLLLLLLLLKQSPPAAEARRPIDRSCILLPTNHREICSMARRAHRHHSLVSSQRAGTRPHGTTAVLSHTGGNGPWRVCF